MARNIFKGLGIALITPFTADGEVDYKSLKRLVEYQLDNGADFLCILATTGEAPCLSTAEKDEITVFIKQIVNGRIPILKYCGGNNTAAVVDEIKTTDWSGIDGILSICPYYNKPSQEGLYQHFKAIAEHTDLPQILYNVPSRTGCDLLPETVGRLAKVKNIIGIKEATGNLTRVNQIKELVSDDFVLLSGDDASALDFMQLGGHGVISVTANVAARDMAQMCKLAAEGHFAEARVINQRLMPLHNKLFVEPNPIPVKWACKELGLVATDTLRLPMTPITDNAREIVKAALKHAGLL